MRNGKQLSIKRRLISLDRRIRILTSLRALVDLDKDTDITERQWSVIQSQLVGIETRLLSRLRNAGRTYLPHIYEPSSARMLNEILGEIIIDLTRYFDFFDTFLDILTQRHPRKLGMMLAGCDVIAKDAITKVGHPALSIVEPPLVFLDRGFGASVLRQDVPIMQYAPNPMSLIQIPYEKLTNKYDLTSILHETGHEVMVRLGLVRLLPIAFKSWLAREKAPYVIRELFGAWSSEIGPDFLTFTNAGSSASSSLRDILSLPQNSVFRISFPHPPPYLRVLLSFQLCRHMWGKGEWDSWENEWLEMYPIDNAPIGTRNVLSVGRKYLPIVARALFFTRFRTLQWKTLPSFFDFASISPVAIERRLRATQRGVLDLNGLTPTSQLAVFRAIKDKSVFSETTIDRLMTKWLIELGKQRNMKIPKIVLPVPVIR